jgi:hypothetical protein
MIEAMVEKRKCLTTETAAAGADDYDVGCWVDSEAMRHRKYTVYSANQSAMIALLAALGLPTDGSFISFSHLYIP